MKLIDYFDRLCIIHLPERDDRYRALEPELRSLGVDIRGPKVRIPHAPKPPDSNGYLSKGVYGSFLSHYEILKEALRDGLDTIWVLEDDAIFSRRMVRRQDRTAEFLRQTTWDMCFFGHSLTHELRGHARGLVPHRAEFQWAHCYAIHGRALPRLVAYLEETMANPPGHPRGGRAYIDGAYSLFRQLNPDIVALVANPVLSLQRGCFSSLGTINWYDQRRLTHPLTSLARSARDEIWRRTGLYLTSYR